MSVEDAEAEDRSQVGTLKLKSLAIDVEDRTGNIALGLGIDGKNKRKTSSYEIIKNPKESELKSLTMKKVFAQTYQCCLSSLLFHLCTFNRIVQASNCLRRRPRRRI